MNPRKLRVLLVYSFFKKNQLGCLSVKELTKDKLTLTIKIISEKKIK